MPTPHPGPSICASVIRGVFRACCDVEVAATHAVSASGRQLHACRLARALQHRHVHPALTFRISLSVSPVYYPRRLHKLPPPPPLTSASSRGGAARNETRNPWRARPLPPAPPLALTLRGGGRRPWHASCCQRNLNARSVPASAPQPGGSLRGLLRA